MRKVTARAIAPIIKRTGFRFSKDYRHGVSRYHKIVYALVDTVGANNIADGYDKLPKWYPPIENPRWPLSGR